MADGRLRFLRGCMAVSILVLLGQLIRWQYLEAHELTLKAHRQRLSVVVKLGIPRADFLDRNGLPLTDRGIVKQLLSTSGQKPVDPFSIGRMRAAYFQNPVCLLPVRSRYAGGHMATHLIGYVNPGDGRGVDGLEEAYDEILRRGTVEAIAEIVDGRRRSIPGLGSRFLFLPGNRDENIQLTIGRAMQEKVEKIADARLPKGAILVMQAKTGEILAMTSRPCYDPSRPQVNLAAGGSPFLNRAITAYQPGSIFKLVVLAAALEDQPELFWRIFHDEGRINIGTHTFRCPGGAHGDLTLADALAFSCNTTFIRIGLMLGAKRLNAMAERLGLGTPVLSCLRAEDAGELPPAIGRSRGDVANTAIGQGDVLVTPLQIGQMVAAIANGGLMPAAYVVKSLPGGGREQTSKMKNAAPIRVLAARTARIMRGMMAGVVDYGTGRAAALPQGAGGKTGTAQTGRVDSGGNPISHAWFAGFAPLANPEYVCVVFVEEGDSGGGIAAPIFKEVMRAILAGTGTGSAKGTYPN